MINNSPHSNGADHRHGPDAKPVNLEVLDLQMQLEDVQQTLAAIRAGGVDAVVVREGSGDQVYTLKSAERPYRLFVEQMLQGAATINRSGLILYSNARFAQMLRTQGSEVSGHYISDFLDAKSTELVTKMMDANDAKPVEVLLNASDGSRIPAMIGLSALDLDGSSAYCLVITDLTAQRDHDRMEQLVAERTSQLEKTHQHLRLSERMAALSTLAAGLGHDMGNLLLPLKIRLDVIESLNLPKNLIEHIRAIRTSIAYLQALTNGLHLFAHDPEKGNTNDDPTDLADWWNDVMPFLRNAIPRHISFSGELKEPLPAACISRQALTQAVYNLAQNAGEALRQRPSGSVCVQVESLTPQRVRIVVADDGPGMDEVAKKHCLEPFFTTKTRGVVTGLGLAIVHGIVNRVGGTIDIESKPNHGTKFILELPATERVLTSTNTSERYAVLSIRAQRISAYLSSLLQMRGFRVCTDKSERASSASLWITDSHQQALSWIDHLEESQHSPLILLLGSAPAGIKHQLLHQVGDSPTPALIRQRLDTVVKAIEARPSDVSASTR